MKQLVLRIGSGASGILGIGQHGGCRMCHAVFSFDRGRMTLYRIKGYVPVRVIVQAQLLFVRFFRGRKCKKTVVSGGVPLFLFCFCFCFCVFVWGFGIADAILGVSLESLTLSRENKIGKSVCS